MNSITNLLNGGNMIKVNHKEIKMKPVMKVLLSLAVLCMIVSLVSLTFDKTGTVLVYSFGAGIVLVLLSVIALIWAGDEFETQHY